MNELRLAGQFASLEAVSPRRDDRVLMRCFAGCRTREVVGALGLLMADLFVRGERRVTSPTIVAEYRYVSLAGEVLARKLRYSNKTFAWRRRGPAQGSWVWGLAGVDPGLYRLPDLCGRSQAFICEGEKAVDRLWSLGVPAACPPCGAAYGTWNGQRH